MVQESALQREITIPAHLHDSLIGMLYAFLIGERLLEVIADPNYTRVSEISFKCSQANIAISPHRCR